MMVKDLLKITVFLLVIIFMSCSKDTVTGPPVYNVKVPPGKLPWPQQSPDMAQSEVNRMIKNMWIMDNFGTYHGSYDAENDITYLYLHDGLDIMLDNGTKLYAVESGYVKSIRRGDDYYGGSMSIGDTPGSEAGMGWEYAHTADFQFGKGDYVNQGEYICNVRMGHVHLSRIKVENGDWADKRNKIYFHPDNFFVYEDTEPPIIEKPFYYFHNNSDENFPAGDPTVVSGEVDIVVAMKDVSECVNNSEYGFLLRWCVAKIEYEISGDQTGTVHKISVDFTKLVLDDWKGICDDRVLIIYKHHTIPVLASAGLDISYAFYNITNNDGTGEFQSLYSSYKNYSWDTESVDANGDPVYPNGIYTITVTAYDFKGNSTSLSDVVLIEN